MRESAAPSGRWQIRSKARCMAWVCPAFCNTSMPSKTVNTNSASAGVAKCARVHCRKPAAIVVAPAWAFDVWSWAAACGDFGDCGSPCLPHDLDRCAYLQIEDGKDVGSDGDFYRGSHAVRRYCRDIFFANLWRHRAKSSLFCRRQPVWRQLVIDCGCVVARQAQHRPVDTRSVTRCRPVWPAMQKAPEHRRGLSGGVSFV